MKIKLIKDQPTEWLGNGFGTATATWVVRGHEHIAVRKLGGVWKAIDTTKQTLPATVIARGDTKDQLLSALQTKIEEDA